MDPEGVLLAFKVLRARNVNFWLFRPLGEEEGGKGMCVLADLFADKSAPTGTASGLVTSRSHRVVFILWGEVGLPY
ncbi:hypothetical protein AL060_10275 [Pseudomonas syringae pv. rhaphiolepidis]|nr:hypothetical protein AL060_10275 [Pseudomonas syringae pv. rhaphiolepidis]